MALHLGIDTGGTYTDAVLYCSQQGVLRKAKALTTHDNLYHGLEAALAQVLPEQSATDAISLVSISTTLATNALVEDKRPPICTLLIGHDWNILNQARLHSALGEDPVLHIDGGHKATGEAKTALDVEAIAKAGREYAEQVQAFAVSAMFSVRNSAHELEAKSILQALTNLPVSCSHELSSNLGAPRRTLTTILNSRLIPLICDLIDATQQLLDSHGIKAKLMMIRGDGAMISAQVARETPVETILSGPAASVIGAAHLAGHRNAVISDIGGTTTDIARLQEGSPIIAAQGARVGGWHTMVKAIEVHSYGIGGDSEISIQADGALRIGPRRVIPISLLATKHGKMIDKLIEQKNKSPIAEHGRFIVKTDFRNAHNRLSTAGKELMELLAMQPLPWAELHRHPRLLRASKVLLAQGRVAVAGLTPSDAAHVLGLHQGWHRQAAELAAEIYLRYYNFRFQTDYSLEQWSRTLLDRVITASTEAILQASHDFQFTASKPLDERTLSWFFSQMSKDQSGDLLAYQAKLSVPIVAIGAPAACYYRDIGKRLDAEVTIPENADVCNALGAVVSGITETVEIIVLAIDNDQFRVHDPEHVKDFKDLNQALSHAEGVAGRIASNHAKRNGAGAITLDCECEQTIVDSGLGKVFIEAKITATATAQADTLWLSPSGNSPQNLSAE